MSRRILVIAVIVAVAALLYFGYANYDAGRAGVSGDVYSNDPRTSKADAEASDGKTTAASGGATVVYPTATPQAATSAPTTSADQVSPPGTNGGAVQGSVPASDTISPDPPNGTAFSGTGKYQLYRQGNITWRLNTETGKSCILFATDEEWKKEKVLRAGCRAK
jgi:hypothetical protein